MIEMTEDGAVALDEHGALLGSADVLEIGERAAGQLGGLAGAVAGVELAEVAGPVGDVEDAGRALAGRVVVPWGAGGGVVRGDPGGGQGGVIERHLIDESDLSPACVAAMGLPDIQRPALERIRRIRRIPDGPVYPVHVDVQVTVGFALAHDVVNRVVEDRHRSHHLCSQRAIWIVDPEP